MESSRELLIHDEMSEKIVRAAENMVTESGAHAITVRKLLLELGITNRVFYNRFHNIGEVLEIVYKNTILKIRESLKSAFDEQKDFFENVSFHDFSSFLRIFIDKNKLYKLINLQIFAGDSITKSSQGVIIIAFVHALLKII